MMDAGKTALVGAGAAVFGALVSYFGIDSLADRTIEQTMKLGVQQ